MILHASILFYLRGHCFKALISIILINLTFLLSEAPGLSSAGAEILYVLL